MGNFWVQHYNNQFPDTLKIIWLKDIYVTNIQMNVTRRNGIQFVHFNHLCSLPLNKNAFISHFRVGRATQTFHHKYL